MSLSHWKVGTMVSYIRILCGSFSFSIMSYVDNNENIKNEILKI